MKHQITPLLAPPRLAKPQRAIILTMLPLLAGSLLMSADPPGASAASLLARLSSGSEEERRTAAEELGKQPPNTECVAALVSALGVTGRDLSGSYGLPISPLGGGEDMSSAPKLTGPCCEALLAYGEPALDEVIKGLNGSNRWVRYGCAWVLGETKPGGPKDDQIRLALRGVMASPKEDSNVMQMAAEALGKWKDKEAAALAQSALQTRKMSGGDVAVLASLVAKTDATEGKKVVLNFARAGQPEGVRSSALVAARWLHDEETLKVLVDAVTDGAAKKERKDGFWLLGTACRSLVGRDAREAVPKLQKALASKNINDTDKLEVAKTLAMLGDTGARETVAAFSTHKSLKGIADRILKSLDTKTPLEPETPPGKFGFQFVHLGGGMMVSVR